MTNERDETIATIKANLKARSGRTWSVKGGRGTAWGWITISAPPARMVGYAMSDEDREILTGLLCESVGTQGVSIPASSDYRSEYVARSAGRTPSVIGRPYWD